MKIIFLDVDGVLNNDTTKERINGFVGIDDSLFKIFVDIIEKTNAKVVISSTWRLDKWSNEALLEQFRKYKIHDNIIGKTPLVPAPYSRGKEISGWLRLNPQITKFVILDDDFSAFDALRTTSGHFARTKEEIGLTKEIADEVIKYLNE